MAPAACWQIPGITTYTAVANLLFLSAFRTVTQALWKEIGKAEEEGGEEEKRGRGGVLFLLNSKNPFT